MDNKKQLLKNVLATIAYYDALDYPLTSFEIWRHLILVPDSDSYDNLSYADIIRILDSKDFSKHILQTAGFYTLKDRAYIIEMKKQREIISTEKIKKAVKYAKFLKYVPFVRMILLTGNVSYRNANQDSDLDVLVACKFNHLWTGRFMMTLFTQIFGIRMHGNKHTDRICLNYYITDEYLKVPTRDLFAAHEYSFAIPIFGMDLYKKFVKTNESWIKNYKPNYISETCTMDICTKDTRLSIFTRGLMEKLLSFNVLEKFLRSIQKKKIDKNPKTYYRDSLILTSDKFLVFLPKPHGPRIFEKYKKRFEIFDY